MRYEDLVGRLFAARRSGAKLELGRIERALVRLGELRARLPLVVQIGGTNGKGSTAAFCESVLRAGGARTGLFTSPHLVRLEERFSVDGDPASEEAVLAAGEAVAACDPDRTLTFFEQVTLIAARVFADAGVDVAIFEVGLGGRLDATTALRSDVAAVTGVALDHTRILGPDVASIAREKAGIFRADQRAVVGASGLPEGAPLLAKLARRAGAPVTELGQGDLDALEGVRLGLTGPHQRANAACALAVCDAVAAAGGPRADAGARERGLAATRLAGRMEEIARSPRILLDGAHNPHAAAALARALRDVPARRVVAVVGVSADKDTRGIVEPVAAAADVVIATEADSDRALPASEVAELARNAAPGAEVSAALPVEDAVARARQVAGAEDAIVVFGSLFVAGEARRAILGGPGDPVPLTDPVATARPDR